MSKNTLQTFAIILILLVGLFVFYIQILPTLRDSKPLPDQDMSPVSVEPIFYPDLDGKG